MSGILAHYNRASLGLELDAMLAAAFPDDRRLTPADLAPIDQFRTDTRGARRKRFYDRVMDRRDRNRD